MYIKINNQEVYYQKLGQGKDLIMLHGWKQDVSTFHNVAEELKKHFTLYLIDLPGFGRSETPKKPFTVTDYAEVIREFIKSKKLLEPNLLGHSLGGRISIKLAAKYPEIINKLVLEDAAGIQPKQDPIKYLIYPLAKIIKAIIPSFFNLREKLRKAVYNKLESDYINAGALKDTLTNILTEDQSNELPDIKNETLIIWGENDHLSETSTANARIMYKKIKNSRLVFLENSGHFPHIENPQMFLYFVRDFLLENPNK